MNGRPLTKLDRLAFRLRMLGLRFIPFAARLHRRRLEYGVRFVPSLFYQFRAWRSGWEREEDGWWCRPVRGGDFPSSAFAQSSHAFRGMDDNRIPRLYCRNPVQACELDAGRMV